MTVRAVIGVPLYGGGEHLREAVESLVQQTYDQLALVFVDDAPDGGSRELVLAHADGRVRISYEANPRRLGLIRNWRRAFEVALERYPEAEFFAWGSDHDAWHARWAERMVAALDANPAAVTAYPLSVSASPGDSVRGPWHFEIRDVADPSERLRTAVAGMSAGNMVYGLHRVQALRRAGVFRPVLLPDRLLVTELALQGELRQVPHVLWYRRQTGRPSLERQRSAFFPDGVPLWARAPWPAQHFVAAARAMLRDGEGPPGISRAGRRRLVLLQGRLNSAYAIQRRFARRRADLVRRFGALYAFVTRLPGGPSLLGLARRVLEALR